MNIDIEAIRARNEARKRGPASEPNSALVALDIDALLEALDEAQVEAKRLVEENADLRASAELWRDLYEAHVRRAITSGIDLERFERECPPDVKDYYAALDRIAVLAEALEGMLRDCEVCAGKALSSFQESGRTEEACRRCDRALGVLQAAMAARSRG